MRAFSYTALVLTVACGTTDILARADTDRERSGGRPRVTFYEHADFRGGSFTVEAGEDLENLTRVRFSNGQGMNDRISSFRLEGGAALLVFHDAGFRGGREAFSHSVSSLADSAPGWNDAISSVRIERGRGGRGPDRDRPDFGRVDPIIRRAYRDILQRDPDDGGLRGYRRNLIEDRWTEEQLRQALRESDEFRDLANRIITEAYRAVLAREPDHRERRRMLEQMVRHGWNEADVRKSLRRDDPPRNRPHPPHGG